MLRIVPATGERLEPALSLLFSDWSAEARARRIEGVHREIENEEFDPRHLLLAEIDAQPIGVQMTILRGDDVGMVWPPVVDRQLLARLNGPTESMIEDGLLTEAARRLDEAGAWIGQVLLEPTQAHEHAAMQRNGFAKLTELRFFERWLNDTVFSPKRETKSPIRYVSYRRSRNRLAFANLLEATYRSSLDCPELSDVRDGRQSLKIHETAGSFKSDMWRLYRNSGTDVGILLMADRPDQRAWEVLYLGVVESARRCGIGRAMLLDAMDAACKAKAEKLLLAADIRNAPAISLYESLGFQCVATRVAFVRLGHPLPRNRTHDATRQ